VHPGLSDHVLRYRVNCGTWRQCSFLLRYRVWLQGACTRYHCTEAKCRGRSGPPWRRWPLAVPAGCARSPAAPAPSSPAAPAPCALAGVRTSTRPPARNRVFGLHPSQSRALPCKHRNHQRVRESGCALLRCMTYPHTSTIFASPQRVSPFSQWWRCTTLANEHTFAAAHRR